MHWGLVVGDRRGAVGANLWLLVANWGRVAAHLWLLVTLDTVEVAARGGLTLVLLLLLLLLLLVLGGVGGAG